jgi:adsorption protein B
MVNEPIRGKSLETLLWMVDGATRELMLFAAVGLFLGGVDDLAVDLIWLWRSGWRRLTVYRRHAPVTAASLPAPANPGRIAVFIGAWDEAAVIGEMLRTALGRFEHDDYRIYVGVYPNDPATIAAVEAVAHNDARVRMVSGELDGPTTKAECLNRLWHALRRDEIAEHRTFKAVVLHDAEDVVHSAELKLFDRLIERFDLVQLPVLPLVDRGSRWISGHYMDEFAEAHGKALIVREALGAGMPSAGVGCALSRGALQQMSDLGDGRPFDADSLTEDYELGLRLKDFGGRGIFVRMPATPGGRLVAVRAHFPATLEEAVRQKTRWMTGIALSGWDRLGWRGGWAERWMRLRDRRAVLAALILTAAYAAALLWAISLLLGRGEQPGPGLATLLMANGALLFWRMAMRFWMVARLYGCVEGLRSVPRTIVANVIAMMAARRAVTRYAGLARQGPIAWDKTSHIFPSALPAE